ncbi:MAG TPA: hypothetical protein VK202_03830 [Bacteroidia bacterium]|nr:hypothetical protein [Bacteroidia bacterium]
MTIKTFWLLFFKILGIFLIVESVLVLPESFAGIFTVFGYGYEAEIIYMIAGAIVLTVLLYLAVINICILKPQRLIAKLRLEEGFEEGERIGWNMNGEKLLSFVAIIIGGYLFVDSLPMLCNQIIVFFQEESLSGKFGDKPSTGWLVLYIVKTLTGYLIVIYHRNIADWLKEHIYTEQSKKEDLPT